MIDRLSDWMAENKGAPVLIGVGLIVLNLLLQPLRDVPYLGFFIQCNLLMHIGIIMGLLGFLIGDAL
jgi:hypothetical protein